MSAPQDRPWVPTPPPDGHETWPYPGEQDDTVLAGGAAPSGYGGNSPAYSTAPGPSPYAAPGSAYGPRPQPPQSAWTPAPAPAPPARTGLVVASVVGGAILMLGVGVGLLYAFGVLDTGRTPPTTQASPVVRQPTPEPTTPSPEPSPSASTPAPDVVIPESTSEVMDPARGPAISPLSWDVFSDNEYTVNDYTMAVVGRYDFACDALPAIPALTDVVPAPLCKDGFAIRAVSTQGPTVAIDLIVIGVGSEKEAEQIEKAFESANAPVTGEPDLALRVPPPAGFESSFAILDAGEGPAFMHSSGSVAMLARLGADDEAEIQQAGDLAKAALYVVVDHELAKLF